jgi:hypothetical protein
LGFSIATSLGYSITISLEIVGKATGVVAGAAAAISNSGSYSITLEISIYPSMIYDNYYAFTLFSLIISISASA